MKHAWKSHGITPPKNECIISIGLWNFIEMVNNIFPSPYFSFEILSKKKNNSVWSTRHSVN